MTALPQDVVTDLERENARLRAELRAAQDGQNAGAEILRTIASAPGDAGRSLQQIAETSARLFGAPSVSIQLVENGEWAQAYRFGDSAQRVRSAVPLADIRVGGRNLPGTVVAQNRQIHIPDLDHLDPSMADWPGPPHARAAGTRTMCGTPLRRDGKAIGVLIVYRDRLLPFTAQELALLQSFADQAVIAIENARLFNETREALERQTATSDILRVINNSGGNLAPVFDSILEHAHHLCGAPCGSLQLYERDRVVPVAIRGMTADFAEFLRGGYPITSGIREGLFADCAVQRVDMAEFLRSHPDEPSLRAAIELGRIGTMVTVPLAKNGATFGRIVAARQEVNSFSDKQIALLQGFADQAVIAIENARLFNETQEALERQTATAEILKVIASSPNDVQPVFDVIVERAVRLCGARMGRVYRYDGNLIRMVGGHGLSVPALDAVQQPFPRPASDDTLVGKVVLSRQPNILADLNEDETVPPLSRQMIAAMGARSQVTMPMLLAGEPIGAITLSWAEPRGYTDQQIMLLQTFADQAVIAIENVRLFNETREALERQTATAEILKVIASSPSDVQPVFEAIAMSSNRLVGGFSTAVFRFVEGIAHLAAFTPTTPAADEVLKASFPRPVVDFQPFEFAQAGEVVQVADTETSAEVRIREIARARGFRSMLFSPLMNKGTPIGLISVTRAVPGLFTPHHVQLLQTFADQAVIAIENVRLFEQVQDKTRDLTESLQQQTATADVLKVISRSAFDLQAVFDTLISSAVELSGAFGGTICLREGDGYRYLATSGIEGDFRRFLVDHPPTPGRASAAGRVMLSGNVESIPDVLEDPDYVVPTYELNKTRSVLAVPLLRNDKVEGALVLNRTEPGLFTARQIELVQTFADQAVIAIENVRLFDEVQAKTSELSEALTYQTGSSNILSVIASSPTDVGPVLKAIVESARELCEADDALVVLKDGNDLVFKEQHGSLPVVWRRLPINRNWATGRTVVDGIPVHVHDLLSAEGEEFPEGREIARRDNVRTILTIPLLREQQSIGAIVLRRTEVHPFSDKQIALLQTFADQAVIAISNVRLFDEVRARTEDLRESLEFQTATSDVLKVISSSPDSLQPVLDVIVDTARHLCGTETSTIFLLRDEKFHIAAASGARPEYMEFLQNNPIALDQPGSSTSRAAREKRTLHIPDIGADPEFGQGPMSVGQRRALLSVPLMREGTAIGVITMRQSHLTPFTERQIEVVQTFADQAVIAISNVRLFEEVQARTRELSKSLDELRTAQDRLIQTEKLASLGQLTAGIAHEIKNPLNFVNNFAALSAELTDELKEVLAPAALDDTTREEVDEITHTLKDNLGKVVQHGKRADSIVKNMLLHSREGSGEHRPADINALLDESLNLAYHGARAEKREFNVTLQRDFDEKAGNIEVFPQEITRVFLNLISNGFYAVTKRKTENRASGFDPIVRATTRNLGDSVEIRIRDNGTGIPAEVKEKMFNPFFTTKPAGEGTGLGLSMSHDIIVKQHGGTIDVETLPGEFTEFRIVLPRTSNLSSKSRG
jgi:two-component system, NtrC family, sensor kinase